MWLRASLLSLAVSPAGGATPLRPEGHACTPDRMTSETLAGHCVVMCPCHHVPRPLGPFGSLMWKLEVKLGVKVGNFHQIFNSPGFKDRWAGSCLALRVNESRLPWDLGSEDSLGQCDGLVTCEGQVGAQELGGQGRPWGKGHCTEAHGWPFREPGQ